VREGHGDDERPDEDLAGLEELETELAELERELEQLERRHAED